MDNSTEIKEPTNYGVSKTSANLKFGIMVALFVGGLYYVVFKT
tara:strand:+ start:317 stop:445 length:129 start_codon:yes stop_codon:yes gene_type:complete